MVTMEKGKQYKFGGDGVGGGGGKIEIWWRWWSKKNNVEKQKREKGIWLIAFLVVERASLPSSSLLCLICVPRISESELYQLLNNKSGRK